MTANQDLNQKIGDVLKTLRTEKGYSRAELASHLKVSYQQVQKYETGANRLSVAQLYTIQNKTGISATNFFETLQLQTAPPNQALTEEDILNALSTLKDIKAKAKIFKILRILLH